MRYLFEDKADDYLSKLFRYSLPEGCQNLLEYANGNGNLVKKSEDMLKSGEIVVVILDTVPANKSIRDIYISLRRLSKLYEYRLIVWNIICAEYYFIDCFGKDNHLKAFRSNVDFDVVSEVKPYKNSILIQSEDDKAFSKTFEKFCKLYIMKNGGECIYPETTFYDSDCECDTECIPTLLADKSNAYRSSYGFAVDVKMDTETLWEIHRRLLKNVNGMIDRYNSAGYLQINPYPEIKPDGEREIFVKPLNTF